METPNAIEGTWDRSGKPTGTLQVIHVTRWGPNWGFWLGSGFYKFHTDTRIAIPQDKRRRVIRDAELIRR